MERSDGCESRFYERLVRMKGPKCNLQQVQPNFGLYEWLINLSQAEANPILCMQQKFEHLSYQMPTTTTTKVYIKLI